MTDGFGGSDHQLFYARTFPSCSRSRAFTLITTVPATTRTASITPACAIADYLELIVLDLVRRPERPAFTSLLASPTAARSIGLGRHDA